MMLLVIAIHRQNICIQHLYQHLQVENRIGLLPFWTEKVCKMGKEFLISYFCYIKKGIELVSYIVLYIILIYQIC